MLYSTYCKCMKYRLYESVGSLDRRLTILLLYTKLVTTSAMPPLRLTVTIFTVEYFVFKAEFINLY